MKSLLLVISLFTFHANAVAAAVAEGIGQSSTSVSHESYGHSSSFHINPVIGIAEMGIRTSNGSSDAGTGISVGALGEIGGEIAFQTGLMYNQFGGGRNGGDQEVDLDYLSVPLLLKYNALGTPEKSLYLRAGLMPGFLVSEQARYNSYRTNDVAAKSFDLPVMVGFGGAIPLSKGIALTLGADYVHSLINVLDNGNGTAHNDGYLVTTGATIGL